MSNKKPQWLLDAEKAAKEFNKTKAAKMSDSEFSRAKNRFDSHYQSTQAKKFWNNPDKIEKQKEVLAALAACSVENGRKVGGSPEGRKRMAALGRANQHIATEASLERITCEVCGNDANTGNYAKWHGKKCRHNEIMEVFNKLPNEFTRKQVKVLVQELGAAKNITRKIVNTNYLDMIVCIHKGTNGSCYDVPRYKKVVK